MAERCRRKSSRRSLVPPGSVFACYGQPITSLLALMHQICASGLRVAVGLFVRQLVPALRAAFELIKIHVRSIEAPRVRFHRCPDRFSVVPLCGFPAYRNGTNRKQCVRNYGNVNNVTPLKKLASILSEYSDPVDPYYIIHALISCNVPQVAKNKDVKEKQKRCGNNYDTEIVQYIFL